MESLYSDYSKAIQAHCRRDFKTAIQEWINLSKLFPKNANIYYLASIDLLAIGENDWALSSIERAIDLNPEATNFLEVKERILKKIQSDEKAYDKQNFHKSEHSIISAKL